MAAVAINFEPSLWQSKRHKYVATDASSHTTVDTVLALAIFMHFEVVT